MFEKELEEIKNIGGNFLFNTVTGAISGELKNSGVEVKSQVVPISGSTTTSGVTVKDQAMSYLPWVIGGVALVGGIFLLKRGRMGARV